MKRNNNTTLILCILSIMFLGLLVMVTLNDKGSATEVGLLNGTHVQGNASDSDCDAMYHAIWAVQDEPSHSTLVDIATSLDCPFEDN